MRAVLDTNVVACALLWDGTPERLIRAAEDEGRLELFTSEALLAELGRILERAKFAAKLAELSSSPAELVARYREIAETVEAPPIEVTALRDPDDASVLACALAARAELIVSGDEDLRSLGQHQGIPILSPAECLQRIGAG